MKTPYFLLKIELRPFLRRIFASIFAVILVIGVFTACAPRQKYYSAQFFDVFDTVTQIRGYADSKEDFQKKADSIYEELLHYHELYDIYNAYDDINNLYTINANAGKGPIKVEQEIIDLLLYSKEMYNFSKGNVNIAAGALLKIWHDYRTDGNAFPEDATLPSMEELEKANEHCNIENLVISEDERTVELLDPQMRLDVGAIAKGYATERVAQKLIASGEENMLLSVGGNVRAIGGKDKKGTAWTIGIENPIHADREEKPYVAKINAKDISIVSSGLYERFYRVDGKIYHHIIDPETLFPEKRYLSLSIFTKDSGFADALSTFLYNTNLEEGKALVETLEGVEALWVLMDESIVKSSGVSKIEKID